MTNVINSNEQMIEKINEVLQNKKNAVVNIVNDKLTISVFSFKQIWFDEQVSVDYKEELLASLRYVYKEHSPEFLYYFTLNELFGNFKWKWVVR